MVAGEFFCTIAAAQEDGGQLRPHPRTPAVDSPIHARFLDDSGCARLIA